MLRAYNPDFEIRKSENNVREFVISTEKKDSHGTVLKASGWDLTDFNRNGAFYYMHNTSGGEMNPDNALGFAKAFMDSNQLIGRATFEPEDINPLSAKILKKIDFGTIKATSVGFIPISGRFGDESKGEERSTYYFDSAVLKEFSIVHIPSNSDALKRSFEAIETFLNTEIEKVESISIVKDFKRGHALRKYQYLQNLGMYRNLF